MSGHTFGKMMANSLCFRLQKWQSLLEVASDRIAFYLFYNSSAVNSNRRSMMQHVSGPICSSLAYPVHKAEQSYIKM